MKFRRAPTDVHQIILVQNLVDISPLDLAQN